MSCSLPLYSPTPSNSSPPQAALLQEHTGVTQGGTGHLSRDVRAGDGGAAQPGQRPHQGALPGPGGAGDRGRRGHRGHDRPQVDRPELHGGIGSLVV